MSAQTVKAALDKDWQTCPECRSQAVNAAVNGFQVNGLSADLMFCLNCGKFYIVYPDTVYLIEKMIDVEIPEATIQAAQNSMKDYQIGKSLYELLCTRDTLV
ncbi:MAG: hypothetical protein HZA15_11115 [Nitrospirae bacterium]|nr:hypothetical protein [Nitrospirota bacterium]